MAAAIRRPLVSASAARQVRHLLVASQSQNTLPAALAEEVASRNSGSIELPADVNEALVNAAKGSSQKHLRGQGLALTDQLKHMTRSRHRGGVQPNLHDVVESAPRRPPRGKARQQRRAMLAEVAGAVPDLTPAQDLMAAVGMPGSRGRKLSRREAAAVEAAQDAADDLEDEGLLLPDDAAQAEVQEVEETPASPALFAPPSHLPADRAARGSADAAERRYDERAALAYAATRMPACYAALRAALGEVARRRGPAWAPTSMLDFGAGPGTASWAALDAWPSASARMRVTAVDASGAMAWLAQAVHAARCAAARRDAPGHAPAAPSVRWTQRLGPSSARAELVTAGYVLCELASDAERRRLVSDLWARTAPGGVLLLVEPGTPSGSRVILAARAQVLGLGSGGAREQGQGEDAVQAHVLAPCPHDGACPLEGAATWCHFTQRFQRTALQRAAKNFAPGKEAVRAHADERYSYVAIAKTARPSPRPQPAIDAVIPLAEDVAEAYRALPPHEVPRRARLQLGITLPERPPPPETRPAQSTGPSQFEWANDDALLLQLAESRGLLDGLDEDTRQLILESIGEDDEGQDGASGSFDDEAFEVLAAMASSEAGQSMHGDEGLGTATALDAGREEEVPVGDAEDAAPAGTSTPELEDVARAAAGDWSRVLRPPLKRGGHVVIDLCAAVEGGTRGEALRQVVSRLGSERQLAGRGAYRLARGLAWGDLWPAYYQAKLPVQRGGAWKKGGRE